MSVGASNPAVKSDVGVVVIGRNEGERLVRCLRSVVGRERAVVYVDSGSSDGSVEAARRAGAEVVELDMSRPFSAARARNEGLEWLRRVSPGLRFVQFVDGDCELVEGWMEAAEAELRGSDRVVVVCGRVRERYPRASLYNRLCDIEFNRLPGDVAACGGIFMARAEAVAAVGGFDPSVIAGEEPELCLRLRRRGGVIRRLGVDMAWHDSAMTRFSQWWKRSVRSGHAYAQAAAMHGRGPERAGVRESVKIWAWAVGLPVVAGALAWPTWGASLGLLLAYPVQAVRTAVGRKEADERRGDRWLYGVSCVAVKWPQAWGQAKYAVRRAMRRAPQIIEHKDAPAAALPGHGRVQDQHA